MYGLTNFQLSHPDSFLRLNVWPYILASLLVIPFLVSVERKAVDPIINMALFSNRRILLTLGISTLTGACLMGIIFVPQWAENILKIRAGSGGYIVTAMSVFSGIAAPMSGVLVDKIGPARVLLLGFIMNIVSLLLMANWVHNLTSMMVALALIGFGIGFTMGSPLNYLMLKQVRKSEAGASLAILSLFRSVGTVLSPSLMVGFLTDAGANLLPALKAKVGVFALMPDVAGSGAASIGREALDLLQTADVTNIVDRLCSFMGKVPGMPSLVKATVVQQIRFAGSGIEVVFQSVLNQAFQRVFLTTALLAGFGVLFTVWLHMRHSDPVPAGSIE
jgi:MFS family permease